MNTHRAVIECSVPPTMVLIAAGPLEHCEKHLSDWVSKHPLAEFETALVLAVVKEG